MMYSMVLVVLAVGSHAENPNDPNGRAAAVVDADGDIVIARHHEEGNLVEDETLGGIVDSSGEITVVRHSVDHLGDLEGETSAAEDNSVRSVAGARAVAASLLEREAAPPSFLSPPPKTIQNLFIPAIHRCNEDRKREFLKEYPDQAASSREFPAEKNLALVHDVFAGLSMPTILATGSVLGFYRNCHVIPTDIDGEVAVLGHWLRGHREIAALKKAFAARNAHLDDTMCEQGPQFSGCQLQVKFAYCKCKIDVFVLVSESACHQAPCSFFGPLHPNSHPHGSNFNKMRYGKVQFEQAEFLDRTFWIPGATLDYVKLNYGKEWEDPSSGPNKAVEFDKETTPSRDVWGETMPPPEYVRSLEPATTLSQTRSPSVVIETDARSHETKSMWEQLKEAFR